MFFLSTDRSKFIKPFYGKDLFDREDGNRLFAVMMAILSNLQSKENFIEFESTLYKNQYGKDLGREHFNDIKQPTDSMEARNETSPAFSVMHLFMLKTLGEQTFRGIWTKAKSISYDNLIKELEEKGPDYFINKDPDDENFQAGKGGLFWHGIIKYLKSIGEKGFDTLCDRVDNVPKEVTANDVVKKKLLAMISFLQSLRNRKNFLAFVQKLGTDKAGAYKGEQFCLIKKPTASEEARNETNPAYNLMIMHLTQAIANETIKMRWFDSYIAGFNQLIQDLIDKGPRHFFRIEENDANFKGPKGGLYWESFVKYVNASGPTRLDKLFEQFSKMPPEVTLAEIFKKKLLDF
ncbi:hypothetical protein WDU94_001752 [Cyamophila willieti]